MDAGLLWTVIGSAAAVPAAVVGAWQLRLQMLEHRARQHGEDRDATPRSVPGALPVAPPVGRLPSNIRGRDAIMAELHRSLMRRMPHGSGWVLTGMGGLGKSSVALAIADDALARGWRVWWITATDTASLTGGMLEVLAQLGAPESVTRPVQEGAPTAPDRAWEFISRARAARKRWLIIFDDADNPSVLAAAGQKRSGRWHRLAADWPAGNGDRYD